MLRCSPTAAFHRKPRSGIACKSSSHPPAHQPYHQHNHNNGTKDSVTEHLISPYILRKSVYAYLPPVRVQIQCHSVEVDRNDGLPPGGDGLRRANRVKRNKTHEHKRIHIFWNRSRIGRSGRRIACSEIRTGDAEVLAFKGRGEHRLSGDSRIRRARYRIAGDQSRKESDEAQCGKPECRRGRRRSNLPGSRGNHSVEQRKSVLTAPVRAGSCRPAKMARAALRVWERAAGGQRESGGRNRRLHR